MAKRCVTSLLALALLGCLFWAEVEAQDSLAEPRMTKDTPPPQASLVITRLQVPKVKTPSALMVPEYTGKPQVYPQQTQYSQLQNIQISSTPSVSQHTGQPQVYPQKTQYSQAPKVQTSSTPSVSQHTGQPQVYPQKTQYSQAPKVQTSSTPSVSQHTGKPQVYPQQTQYSQAPKVQTSSTPSVSQQTGKPQVYPQQTQYSQSSYGQSPYVYPRAFPPQAPKPQQPHEAFESYEPHQPHQPYKPYQPQQPNQPQQPHQLNLAQNPHQPQQPPQPHQPHQPYKPYQPQQPPQPHQPHQPYKPYQPQQPPQPHQPYKPYQPQQPHQSNQAQNPHQPQQPPKPHQPHQPYKPYQPQQPPQPHQPHQPYKPYQPQQPPQPHQPHQPYKPYQPQQPHQSNPPQPPSKYQPGVPKQPSFQSCEVAESQKVPCGGADISPAACEAISCCFDGRQCYFGKAVTVQCTKDAQFIVVVAKDATLPNIDLGSISLLGQGQGCTHVASNSEFLIYQFPVTACGSVVMEEPGVIIYENRMFSSFEVGLGSRGIITRDSSYELLFQCRYIGTSIESLVVEVFPPLQPPLSVSALGPIRVDLRLANGQCSTKGCNEVDVAYSSFFTEADYPVTRVLRDPVYAEVRLLEKTDPKLVLTLGRCWTTTTPNPHSLPQWEILTDGCPYMNDRYMSSLVPVGPFSGLDFPTHYRRFIFKMFTFVDPNLMEPMREQVYLHCSSTVCTAGLGFSCEPSCFRKRKRDVKAVDQTNAEPKVVASVGPVIMIAPEN